jgi:hypothetical protein
MADNKVILNGSEVTADQLKEAQESKGKNEKIVEVSPNTFKTLKRMQG